MNPTDQYVLTAKIHATLIVVLDAQAEILSKLNSTNIDLEKNKLHQAVEKQLELFQDQIKGKL